MELICEDCHAILQLADERLPPNRLFRLDCPRCKSKIVVNTKNPKEVAASKPQQNMLVVDTQVSRLTGNTSNGFPEEIDEPMNSNQPSALLYLSPEEIYEPVKTALREMGYVLVFKTTSEQAVEQLQLNQFQIVVFASQERRKIRTEFTDYLDGLNMNLRREMYVALIGEYFRTGDHLQAFFESVDLVLHPNDLPHIGSLIKRGLLDRARFYKVFVECLTAAGKRA